MPPDLARQSLRPTRLINLGRRRVSDDLPLHGLEHLGIRPLRFQLTAQAPTRLPPFLGSTLRGAIGHALRLLHPEILAETFDAPRPGFVLRLPPPRRPGPWRPGEPLEFGVTLLGQHARHADTWIQAVEHAAWSGLGVERARFDLWPPVCLGDPRARADGAVPVLHLADAPPPPGPLRLRFLTPLSLPLGRHKRPDPAPGLHQVLRAILRRCAGVIADHCGGALDLPPWEARIAAATGHTAWDPPRPLRRRSNRQDTTVELHGVCGVLTLTGDAAPLWPLLRCAELIHVGRVTSMGFGHPRLERP